MSFIQDRNTQRVFPASENRDTLARLVDIPLQSSGKKKIPSSIHRSTTSRPFEGENTSNEIDRTDSGYGRYASAAAFFSNRV
jgi:hypothetical protein